MHMQNMCVVSTSQHEFVNRLPHLAQINHDSTWRFVITFATRDVADSWYRAVTDSVANGYSKFAAVKRVTPQFYTHDPGAGNIQDTITDKRVAADFLKRVFFTLMDDRGGRKQSIIPILSNNTEHVSGDRSVGSWHIIAFLEEPDVWLPVTTSTLRPGPTHFGTLTGPEKLSSRLATCAQSSRS